MEKIVLILLIAVAGNSLRAQNVHFNWAKQLGRQDGKAYSNSIVTDAAGNIYTTGFFYGTVDFDPGPNVFTMSSGNNKTFADMFICKLNPAGDLIWAKQMGGGTGAATGGVYGNSIVVDAAGNVYTAGSFSGTADFDPGTPVFNLSSAESTFIVKLSAAGNFVWAGQIESGNIASQSKLMAIGPAGNLYITGSVYGVVDADPGPGVFNLTSSAERSAFIAAFNSAGSFLWAKLLGDGTGTLDVFSIGLDAAGDIYSTGRFTGTGDFDPGPSVFNMSSSIACVFVSKLDAAGNFIWAKQFGEAASNGNESYSLAVDGPGNVYTTGFFGGTVDFDPGLGVYNLSAVAADDVFVTKLDANGQFVWAKQMGGSGFNAGNALATDDAGNIYATGRFEGSLSFDSNDCSSQLRSAGGADIFVFKLTGSGRLVWAKQMGGAGDEAGVAIAAGAAGDLCITGEFAGTADFDPGISTHSLSAAGQSDVFIEKMSPCSGSTVSSLTVSSCNAYTLHCKTYTESGVYSQIVSNTAGCDSIITLNLTISNNNSSMTRDTATCKSYYWNGQTLTHSGVYRDTLTAAGGCDSIEVLHLLIKPVALTHIVQGICSGDSFLGYTQSGSYTDTLVAANGCDSIRFLELTVQPYPKPDLGNEQELCAGDSLVLYAGLFDSYRWQDGSTQNHFTVKSPGLYSVAVSNQCSSAQAQIAITDKVCHILFPSTFTPNGNGRNEEFKILDAPALSDYSLSVFNRWGQKVFETRDYKKGWDGTVQGQTSPMGVYAWFCTFRKSGGRQKTDLHGTLLLLR